MNRLSDMANFLSFEQWKKAFPELIGRFEPCSRCDGEGCRWDEVLEEWWFCPRCEGEGVLSMDRKMYEIHIKQEQKKLLSWIEGESIKTGPPFKRVTDGIKGYLEWGYN